MILKVLSSESATVKLGNVVVIVNVTSSPRWRCGQNLGPTKS